MVLMASQSMRPNRCSIAAINRPISGQRSEETTMLKLGKTVLVAGFAFLIIGAMAPARAGTADEAKALGEKAVALIAAEGEKAFPLLSDLKGEYIKGDMYVVVLDHQGVVRANVNPKLIGVNMWEAT